MSRYKNQEIAIKRNKPFGTDSERYFSALLNLDQIPDRNCLPDLITFPHQPVPRIAFESKSSRHKHASLVDYQFQYAYTTESDYDLSTAVRDGANETFVFEKHPKFVPLYYMCIARNDSFT